MQFENEQVDGSFQRSFERFRVTFTTKSLKALRFISEVLALLGVPIGLSFHRPYGEYVLDLTPQTFHQHFQVTSHLQGSCSETPLVTTSIPTSTNRHCRSIHCRIFNLRESALDISSTWPFKAG